MLSEISFAVELKTCTEKILATFSENILSTSLCLLVWKRRTLFNKYCEQLNPKITRESLYLVTSAISLKISSNHKKLKNHDGSQLLKSQGKPFLMRVGLNRKRNDTSKQKVLGKAFCIRCHLN